MLSPAPALAISRRTSWSLTESEKCRAIQRSRNSVASSTAATSAVVDDIGLGGMSTSGRCSRCSRMYDVTCEGALDSFGERNGSAMGSPQSTARAYPKATHRALAGERIDPGEIVHDSVIVR